MLQVAVGVISNAAGEILLAQRKPQAHQGGLWEFVGGKLECEETAEQALVRELDEELGIRVQALTPLIRLTHSYADLDVCLQVFWVNHFTGTPYGREGQALQWVKKTELALYPLPAANKAIVHAVQLPPYYAILDDNAPRLLLAKLTHLLNSGITLIQARLKRLAAKEVSDFMALATPLCADYGALLLINSDVATDAQFSVDGLHLTSTALLALNQRPSAYRLLAASCHNLTEVLHAQAIGVDFIVISPVQPTHSHPNAKPLGWQGFAALAAQCNCVVYALGGLAKNDLLTAQQAGGQGIAAISAFL